MLRCVKDGGSVRVEPSLKHLLSKLLVVVQDSSVAWISLGFREPLPNQEQRISLGLRLVILLK